MLSLIVALFALGGATVAPTRGVAGTSAAAIVWQARETRTAPVSRAVRRRAPALTTGTAQPVALVASVLPLWFVRHALFQRPPPFVS